MNIDHRCERLSGIGHSTCTFIEVYNLDVTFAIILLEHMFTILTRTILSQNKEEIPIFKKAISRFTDHISFCVLCFTTSSMTAT